MLAARAALPGAAPRQHPLEGAVHSQAENILHDDGGGPAGPRRQAHAIDLGQAAAALGHRRARVQLKRCLHPPHLARQHLDCHGVAVVHACRCRGGEARSWEGWACHVRAAQQAAPPAACSSHRRQREACPLQAPAGHAAARRTQAHISRHAVPQLEAQHVPAVAVRWVQAVDMLHELVRVQRHPVQLPVHALLQYLLHLAHCHHVIRVVLLSGGQGGGREAAVVGTAVGGERARRRRRSGAERGGGRRSRCDMGPHPRRLQPGQQSRGSPPPPLPAPARPVAAP